MGPENLPFPSHMVNTLKRRGVNPMVLMNQSPMQTQVTPSSPNYDPSMQTPQATPMPDHPARMGTVAPPMGGQPAPAQPPAVGTPAPAPVSPAPQDPFSQSIQGQGVPGATPNPQQSEAESIISALSDRLKHHSKQAAKFLDSIIAQTAPPETANPTA